jgi:hypothetical protein
MTDKQGGGLITTVLAFVLAYVALMLTFGSGMHVRAMTTAADPCTSADVAKSAVSITAGGKVLAGVAGKQTFVCGIYATLAGTTPTIQLQAGTGTNCGNSTATLSGAFAPSPNGTEFFLGDGMTTVTAGAGLDVCLTLTGSGAGVVGLMDYVQQ